MRRWVLAVIFGTCLFAGSPARGEMDEFVMTNWEMVASACAKYQQIFVSYGLEGLFPDLKDRILGHARDQRASEAQLATLERRFAEGRSAAIESGFTPGSRTDRVDKGRLEYLHARAEQVEEICTKSYQSLALMGALPIDGAGSDGVIIMGLWRSSATSCGKMEVWAGEFGYGDRLPNMMAEFLGNARAEGATNLEIEELARRYEQGRAEQQEMFRNAEERHGGDVDWSKLSEDESARERYERIFGDIWRRCALNEW